MPKLGHQLIVVDDELADSRITSLVYLSEASVSNGGPAVGCFPRLCLATGAPENSANGWIGIGCMLPEAGAPALQTTTEIAGCIGTWGAAQRSTVGGFRPRPLEVAAIAGLGWREALS